MSLKKSAYALAFFAGAAAGVTFSEKIDNPWSARKVAEYQLSAAPAFWSKISPGDPWSAARYTWDAAFGINAGIGAAYGLYCLIALSRAGENAAAKKLRKLRKLRTASAGNY